jgi:peptidoglycan/LPS O-acetylase OafA/YrhL
MPSSSLVEVRHRLPPLKALTTLRLVAAMYVVMYHMDFQESLANHPLFANLLGSGYTGVTFFFVLSGFILAYNYPEIASTKDFWVARFARIYPAYFLAALFAMVRPVDWHLPHEAPKAVAALLLVQGWWPAYSDALNQYGWTVSVEAFFYLIFPFLLPLVWKMRRRTFYIVQAAYLLLLVAPILLSHTDHRDLALRLADALESHNPAVRLNAFLVGVFFGTRWLKRIQGRHLSEQPAKRWLPWLGLIAAAILLCATWDGSALPLRTGLLIYACVLLIYGLAQVEWKLLSSHWLQVGGEISYGIYILQSPVSLTYAAINRHLAPAATPSRILYVVVLIAVAYASFRWYETPMRLMIRKLWSGRPVSTRPV